MLISFHLCGKTEDCLLELPLIWWSGEIFEVYYSQKEGKEA
jgi:hypothetical protein